MNRYSKTVIASETARLRSVARKRSERYETGRFLIEGPKLIEEALRANVQIITIWVEQNCDLPTQISQLIEESATEIAVHYVPAKAIQRVATTKSPQPLLAEAAMGPQRSTASALAGLDPQQPVMVALDINDPGNLGTIARSALASGFGALICLGETTDPFGPKALRSCAGALFRLPVIQDSGTTGALQLLKKAGFSICGTRMRNAIDCDNAAIGRNVAIVMGNEANGISSQDAELIDQWIAIPMLAESESLNVAMAATILCYESARQRRMATTPQSL